MHVDANRCLGTPGQDGLLTTDPTQAIFVAELIDQYEARKLLIVPIQNLIERICSVSAGDCVPWDEWGRGAVVMEVPRRGSGSGGSHPLVQGVHVVMAKEYTTSSVGEHHPHICTFDFSRRGCSVLPSWDGIERRARFEDGRVIPLQGNEYVHLVSSFLP